VIDVGEGVTSLVPGDHVIRARALIRTAPRRAAALSLASAAR